MASIVGSTLVTGSSASAATSFTTASISPSANNLILIAVRSNGSGVPRNTPTITGAGLTWVLITTTVVNTTNTGKISLLRALSASPSSGTLTIDFGGQTQDECHWNISQFSNVDISGTNGSGALVQSNASNSGTSSTGPFQTTLSAFSSTLNATYGFLGTDGGSNVSESATPGSGFTQLGNDNSNNRLLLTEWRNDNATTVNFSITNATRWGVIAMEIKNQTSLISISDNNTVSDVIGDIIAGDARNTSVSDNATVSELATAQIVLNVSIVDSITVAETTTLTKATTASVSDNVTVTEAITAPGGSWKVNVSDNLTVGEILSSTPTQFGNTLDNATVSENITIKESNMVISIVENITVSEDEMAFIGNLPLSISDNITISEQVGIHRVRPTWTTNWGAETLPTTKWKKDPN